MIEHINLHPEADSNNADNHHDEAEPDLLQEDWKTTEEAVIAHHIAMPYGKPIFFSGQDINHRTHRNRRNLKDNNSKTDNYQDTDDSPFTESDRIQVNATRTEEDLISHCCPQFQCKCDIQKCSDLCTPPKQINFLLPLDKLVPGKCCSYDCVYPGACISNGQIYQDHEEFVSSDDPCNHCTCYRGKISCHTSMCRRPACPNVVRLPGECCAACQGFCPGDEHCDRSCNFGYTRNEQLDCLQCKCVRGNVTVSIHIQPPSIVTNADPTDSSVIEKATSTIVNSSTHQSPYVVQSHEGKNHTAHHTTDPVINSNYLFYLLVGLCVIIVAIFLGVFAWRFFTSSKYYAIPLHVKSKYVKSESNCLEM